MKGDTNQKIDVFVRDRRNKLTTRVSVATGGAQAQGQSTSIAMSSDGRYVAFQSDAANLFTGDANATYDVFVRDRLNGTTRHVSRSSGGIPGDAASILPAISANGRVVAFASLAKNLASSDSNGVYDVFARDLSGGKTSRVSVATGGAQGDRASGLEGLAISGDGNFVAFTSDARQLVGGDGNFDTDIFVRDRAAGTTTRVSLATGGAEADGFSFHPAISADGRLVAFGSWADNLASNGANGVPDVFVRDRVAGTTTLISAATDGSRSNRHNGQGGVAISSDGHWVAFQSYASNLVLGDTNSLGDIFYRDR